MFKCLRVYPNGDARFTVCATETECDEWLKYNRVYRFGNALFVNGICPNKETHTAVDESRLILHDRGYLTTEHITLIEKKLKEIPSLMRNCGLQEFSLNKLSASAN